MTIPERFKFPVQTSPSPGPGAYNIREVDPLLNSSKGCTIKFRPGMDEYREKRRIPGRYKVFSG
jgi:hypothetical protein